MIVWACIAPHGGELIAELAGDELERMQKTRSAMVELGKRIRASAPDTIVVYTPHGIDVEGYVSISVTTHAAGSLDGSNRARISAEFPVDQALAESISEQADAYGVPVAKAFYLENEVPAPSFPLDWGALVPLWFMGVGWNPLPKIVVICPSRSLERSQLIAFGEATAEAAIASNRRIALICSADQGHGHTSDGPYGFAAESAQYDQAYCQAVQEDLASLLHWNEEWIEAALTDSYWQTLMLHGATRSKTIGSELLSYEAPTYFGMACAEYRIG